MWGWSDGEGERVSLGDNENALKLIVAVETQFWDEETREWRTLHGKVVWYVNRIAVKLFF